MSRGSVAGNGDNGNKNLEAALSYAARGLKVFPCRPRGKEPLTAHGFKDATTDPEQIKSWWAKWPDANVAIATGKDSGIVVVDVDPRNGGNVSLELLEAKYGRLPETVEALTGGGGQHFLFEYPKDAIIHCSSTALGAGIDVKADGGYIVAPPSVHPSGKVYEWELSSSFDDVPIAPVPAWMLPLITAQKTGGTGKAADIHIDYSDFNRELFEEKLELLLSLNQNFLGSWNRTRTDGGIKDRSSSGWDQSLANIALMAEFSYAEIYELLKLSWRKHGEDEKAERYVRVTLASALAWKEDCERQKQEEAAQSEASTGAPEAPAPVTVNDGALHKEAADANGALSSVGQDGAVLVDAPVNGAADHVSEKEAKGSLAKEEKPARSKKPRELTVRLAEAIAATNYFARDPSGTLYVYQNGVYQSGGELFVKQRVKRLMAGNGWNDYWSRHQAEEVVGYLAVDAPELWEHPGYDVINVKNGLIDVRTGECRAHTPEWRSVVQLPVLYDPAAECPRIDQFIGEVFPEDTVNLGYEIAADIITPDRSNQKALLLLGPGGNGKSTLLAVYAALLGRENVSTVSLQKLESDRFAPAALYGKLANICPDLPTAHLTGTSTFKAITGGDVIAAERKFKDVFSFRPFSRLIFSANHPPRSSDDSSGFFQRWLVVNFERSFRGTANEIPQAELLARLTSSGELSGLLNKALAVINKVRTKGFMVSASMQEAAEEFRKETDPFAVWLENATVRNVDAMVSKRELYEAYKCDCVKAGRAAPVEKSFSLMLQSLCGESIQARQRTYGGKANVHVWVGIGLKTLY